MAEHQHIGTFIKPHGLKGAVVCHIEPMYIDVFQKASMLFIDLQGSLVPHTVLDLSTLTKDRFKVTLEGIDDQDEAEGLRGKAFFLPQNDLPKHIQVDLTGYDVIIEDHGHLGKIDEVIEQSVQALLQVSNGDDSWLIPFVDKFILDIDTTERTILLELPNGLLDL